MVVIATANDGTTTTLSKTNWAWDSTDQSFEFQVTPPSGQFGNITATIAASAVTPTNTAQSASIPYAGGAYVLTAPSGIQFGTFDVTGSLAGVGTALGLRLSRLEFIVSSGNATAIFLGETSEPDGLGFTRLRTVTYRVTPDVGDGTITLYSTVWKRLGSTNLQIKSNELSIPFSSATAELTIGDGAVSGQTLTFPVNWNVNIGTQFTAEDITIIPTSVDITASNIAVTATSGGVSGQDFTVSATLTGVGATRISATVRANAVLPTPTRLANLETSRNLGTFLVGDYTIGTQETTTQPIVEWSAPPEVQTGLFTVSGVWTRAPSGFDETDVLVSTGATKSNFMHTPTHRNFSIDVTPPVNSEGQVRISIPCDAITGGNVYQEIAVLYDTRTSTTSRTLSWIDPPAATQRRMFTLEGEWSSSVTNFATDDVHVCGGSKGDFTYPKTNIAGDENKFTVDVTPPPTSSGVIRTYINCNSVDEGNSYTEVIVPYDTQATTPAGRILSWIDPPAETQDGMFTLTGRWSGTVASSTFLVTAFDVDGGTRGVLTYPIGTAPRTPEQERTFTLGVTPNSDSIGVVRVSINCNAITEGNAYSEVVVPYDTRTAGARTLTWVNAPANISATYLLEGEWSGTVASSGFDTDDVKICGGSKGTFTYPKTGTGNENKFTVQIIPNADSDGIIKVYIDCDAISEGNAYIELLIPYDTRTATDRTVTWANAPTTAISSELTLEGEWSDTVTNFVTGDIEVCGATKGDFNFPKTSNSGDENKFTVVITPNADSNGIIKVSIDCDAVDPGNPYTELLIPFNTGTTSTTRTVRWVSPPTDTQTGMFTLTGIWSDTVASSGFVAGDIHVEGGTRGTLTYPVGTPPRTTLEQRTFTIGVTPTANSHGLVRVSIGCNAVDEGNVYSEVEVPYDTRTATDRTVTWANAPTTAISSELTLEGEWSDSVTNFVTGDIEVCGATKGDFTYPKTGNSGDENKFTVVITPNADSSGIIKVSIDCDAVDPGNPYTELLIPFNTRTSLAARTLAWIDPPTDTQNGMFTLTGRWSGTVASSGFVVGDIDVCGGTKGTLTYPIGTAPRTDEEQRTFTLGVTPTSDSFGVVRVSIDCDAIDEGNAYSEVIVPYDTRTNSDRTLTWSPPSGTINSPITLTGTWSGTVATSGFTAEDVQVCGATGSGFTYPQSADPADTETFKITITPHTGLRGIIKVYIDCDAIDEGNPYTEVLIPYNTITDPVQQEITWINAPSSLSEAAAYTLEGEWSDTVTNFATEDIDVCGATKGDFNFPKTANVGDENKFTVVITPNANSSGIIKVSIDCNIVSPGNPYTELLIPYDTRTETADRTVTWANAPTTAISALYTLEGEWSGSVTNFTTSDVTVTGALSSVVTYPKTANMGDENKFTVAITPVSGSSGLIKVSIDCDTVDEGNPYTELLIPFNTVTASTARTVTWANAPTTAISALYTLEGEWSGTVTNFTTSDVMVTGAMSSTVTYPKTSNSGDENKFTVAITPNADSSGVIRVSIDCDSVDEGNAYIELLVPYNTTSAALRSVIWDVPEATQTGRFSVEGKWTDSVSPIGFSSSEVTVEGGTKIGGSYSSITRVFSFDVRPTADSSGFVRIFVDCNVVDEGNEYSETLVPYDTRTATEIPPTVTWSAPETTQTGNFSVSGTWSKSVTDFDSTDVDVSGGARVTTPTDSWSYSGNTFSLTVDPTNNFRGVVRVSIDCGAVDPDNGYTEVVIPVDTTTSTEIPPTVEWDAPSTTQTGNFRVMGTWSKSVTGFSPSSVTISGGARVTSPTDTWSYTASSGVFSFMVDPSPNYRGVVRVSIDCGAVTPNNGYQEVVIPVDTTTADEIEIPPTVAWSAPETTQTGNFSVSGTWSKSVTDFDSTDVDVSGGARVTSPTDSWSYSGNTFSLMVDPDNNFRGVVRVSIDCGSVDPDNGYTEVVIPIDTTTAIEIPPTVTWSAPDATQTGNFEVTGTWSRTVTGFGVGSVDVCGGEIVRSPSDSWSYTASSGVFSFMVDPTDDVRGVVRVSIACGEVTPSNGYQEVVIPIDTRATPDTPRYVDWTGTPQDTQDSAYTVMGEWNDSVTGFVVGDIEVCGGTKGTFTYPVTGDGNENKFTLGVTPPSNQSGVTRVYINCNSVEEGNGFQEVVIPYDTRTEEAVVTKPSIMGWDVPDEPLTDSDEMVEVLVTFDRNVRKHDGTPAGAPLDSSSFRIEGLTGIEEDDIEVTPITSSTSDMDALKLRVYCLPTTRVANSTAVNFRVVITGERLDHALMASAIMVSAGSVTGVCNTRQGREVSFTVTAPASSAGTITITALSGAGQFTNLSGSLELGSIKYGTLGAAPTATIGMGSLSGSTFTFPVEWSLDVGSEFTADDVTIASSNSSMSVSNINVSDTAGGDAGQDFTVSATVGGFGSTTLTATIKAKAIPENSRAASARTSSSAGTITRRDSGFTPTLGNPVNATFDSLGRITSLSFQIPVTWSESDAQTSAASAFTAADVSASFVDVGHSSYNTTATIGTPTRVGSTGEWRVPITMPAPTRGETRTGNIEVTVRAGALPQTDERNASLTASRTYTARIAR